MDNQGPFAQGIQSLLIAEWRLRCETPLVIRNGQQIRYTENNEYPKERGGNLKFQWEPWQKGSDGHAVDALCYHYQVKDGELKMVHQVPASSVRGALRSWSVQHLVSSDYHECLLPPKKGDQEQAATRLDRIREGRRRPETGLPLLASLFGMALDTSDDEPTLSQAGRLLVETEPFASADRQAISANGTVSQGNVGPGNARRHMAVRNPLDRVTHAARDGGLHHFLEFSRGETFQVRLKIRNAEPTDVAMLGAWVREIDDGLLRLGALSSIGRGRLSLTSASYTLWWLASGEPEAPEWPGLVPCTEQDDPLSGIYLPYTLPPESLSRYGMQAAEEGSDGAQS